MTFVAAFGAAEKPTHLSSLTNVLEMNDQTSTSDVEGDDNGNLVVEDWWCVTRSVD